MKKTGSVFLCGYLFLVGCSDVKLFYLLKTETDAFRLNQGNLVAGQGNTVPGVSTGLATAITPALNEDVTLKNTRSLKTESTSQSSALSTSPVPSTADFSGSGAGVALKHPIVKIEFRPYEVKMSGFNDKKTLSYVLLDKDGKEVDKSAYPIKFSSDNPDFKVNEQGEVTAKNSSGTAIVTAILGLDSTLSGTVKVFIGSLDAPASGGGGGGGGGAPPPAPPPAVQGPPQEDTVDGTVIFS